jgi:hypothetical protein
MWVGAWESFDSATPKQRFSPPLPGGSSFTSNPPPVKTDDPAATLLMAACSAAGALSILAVIAGAVTKPLFH